MTCNIRKLRIVIVLILLLSGISGLASVQPANAVTGNLRLGIMEDINPAGPLYTGELSKRSWASIVSGLDGSPKAIVVEVVDADPIANSTGPGGSGGIDTVKVDVTSDSDEDGIVGLVLRETTATSGVFRGSFRLDEDDTSSSNDPAISDHTSLVRPFLEVAQGDEVTVSYSDADPVFKRTAKLEIEITPPTIRDLNPVHNSFVTRSSVDVTALITDEDSGVDENNVFFLVSQEQLEDDDFFDRRTGEPDPLNEILANNPDIVRFAPTDVDEIDSSENVTTFLVEGSVTIPTSGGFGETYVTIVVLDEASNLAVYDADVIDDDVVLAKYSTDSEAPQLFQAHTGVDWNTKTKKLTMNNLNKIQVIFRDRSDLEPTSIQVSDFQVAGHEVIGVDWYDHDPVTRDADGSTLSADDDKAFIRRMVFLTLAENLSPNDRPEIFLVPNGVTDKSGNVLRSDSELARDSIGTQLVVESISTALAGRDTKVVIVVRADEPLGSNRRPTVNVTNVTNRSNVLPATIETIGANQWRATVNAPTVSTIYNVFVSAQDSDNNFVSVGLEPLDLEPSGAVDGILDGFFDNDDNINDDAIYFEADRDLSKPKVTPKNGDGIAQRASNTIRIDFNSVGPGEATHEGNEYRADTYGEITLTKLLLDNVDVLAEASSDDNRKFVLIANELSLGDHTLVINARDEAGNQLTEDMEVEFEVTVGDRFSLNIQSGWNLISFPNTPANTSIDSVFPPTAPIRTVFSYDSTVPGGWLVAVRDMASDGTFRPFLGDLKTITPERGFWVQSDTTGEISVNLHRVELASNDNAPHITPSEIQISTGWNLVPVVDVTGELNAGDVIDADIYFSGLENLIAGIYTFDELTEQWNIVVMDGTKESGTQDELTQTNVPGQCATCPLDNNERLHVGKAYWVFTNGEGVLVP